MNKRVHLITTACLDEDSLLPGLGGLQRWCRDLAFALSRRGVSVTVFQKAARDFAHQLAPTIEVRGLAAPPRMWGHVAFARRLARLVDKHDPLVFVSQELMVLRHFEHAAAVNHGIWWDADFGVAKLIVNKALQSRTVRQARGVICVDTNYINWCHAEISGRTRWREKLRYIPNYADEKLFHDADVRHIGFDEQPLRILCPRRLEDRPGAAWDGRGALLLLEALVLLHADGVRFEAEFAGKGASRRDVERFAEAHGMGSSVRCAQYDLDDMAKAYSWADVVVIPTAAHEGTSLAAVEAMCCGKPVVVTHIGGLPNLVLDEVNGFVADLSPLAVSRAIQRAARRKSDLAWRANAAFIGQSAFGKQRWELQVVSAINDFLQLDIPINVHD